MVELASPCGIDSLILGLFVPSAPAKTSLQNETSATLTEEPVTRLAPFVDEVVPPIVAENTPIVDRAGNIQLLLVECSAVTRRSPCHGLLFLKSTLVHHRLSLHLPLKSLIPFLVLPLREDFLDQGLVYGVSLIGSNGNVGYPRYH